MSKVLTIRLPEDIEKKSGSRPSLNIDQFQNR